MPTPSSRRPSGPRFIVYPGRRPRIVAAALAMALAACGRADKDAAVGTDSAMLRDLQMAQQEPSTATPTFSDTAMGGAPERRPVASNTPAPPRPVPRPAPARVERQAPAPTPTRQAPVAVAPTPEPTPAPVTPADVPGKRTGRISAGTGIDVTTGDQVCTLNGRPGDKIVAKVSADVTGADGAVIPAGSTAVLEVASVTRGDTPEGAQLVFRVRTLDVGGDSYSVVGKADATPDLKRTRAPGASSTDKKKVIGGAIAGAILGQVMGKDTKSTIIGAAAGGAAGAVAAKVTAKYDGCLAAGSTVRVVLEEPVSIAIRG